LVQVTASLRERKKSETRDALTSAALDLFELRGFDGVTVDDIAARANVSPRTFFRYFGSKEAVLYPDQDYLLSLMREAMTSRPADEHPLLVLRAALAAVTRHTADHREHDLRRARLAETGAAVASYQRSVLAPEWEDMFTETLADRLATDPTTDPRPRLFAGVAMAVMAAAGVAWRASNGRDDPVTLLDDAFGALDAGVLEALGGPAGRVGPSVVG
jgi:AcrR family transcriptional regulator